MEPKVQNLFRIAANLIMALGESEQPRPERGCSNPPTTPVESRPAWRGCQQRGRAHINRLGRPALYLVWPLLAWNIVAIDPLQAATRETLGWHGSAASGQQDNNEAVTQSTSNSRHPVTLELPPAIVTSQTNFDIPFRTDDIEGRLVEVQLYVSTDMGQSWQLYARQSPVLPRIPFQSVGDGQYLFALKTLDRDGRLLPTGPPVPTLRLVIDTQDPQLSLQVDPDKSGRLAISWLASDPNLDRNSLTLSYRPVRPGDAANWQPLPTGSGANADQQAELGILRDRVVWQPDTPAETIVLKAEIRDFAGNITTQYQPLEIGRLAAQRPGPVASPIGHQLSAPDPRLAVDPSGTLAPRGDSRLRPRLPNDVGGPSPIDPSQPIDWPPSEAPSPSRGTPFSATTPETGPMISSAGTSSAGVSSAGTGSLLGTGPAIGDRDVPRLRGADGNSHATEPRQVPANIDPFRQMDAHDPAFRPEDRAGQNLAIAVGSTLQGQNVAGTLRVPPANQSETSASLHPQNVAGTLRVPPAKQSDTNTTVQNPQKPPDPTALDRHFVVNSRQFRLRYQIEGLAPDRVQSVAIYGSTDMGRTWHLWTTDPDKASPVEISVPAEGRYGFRVLVSSVPMARLSPPQPGDVPELVVDVVLPTQSSPSSPSPQWRTLDTDR